MACIRTDIEPNYRDVTGHAVRFFFSPSDVYCTYINIRLERSLAKGPRQTINVAMIIIYISAARLENWPPPNKLSAISFPRGRWKLLTAARVLGARQVRPTFLRDSRAAGLDFIARFPL